MSATSKHFDLDDEPKGKFSNQTLRKAVKIYLRMKGDSSDRDRPPNLPAWDHPVPMTPVKGARGTEISCGVYQASQFLNTYVACWHDHKKADPKAFFLANILDLREKFEGCSALLMSDFVAKPRKGYNRVADRSGPWSEKGKTSEFVKFVETTGLGTLYETDIFKNRNSGNNIQVWMWLLPKKADITAYLKEVGLIGENGRIKTVASLK